MLVFFHREGQYKYAALFPKMAALPSGVAGLDTSDQALQVAQHMPPFPADLGYLRSSDIFPVAIRYTSSARQMAQQVIRDHLKLVKKKPGAESLHSGHCRS